MSFRSDYPAALKALDVVCVRLRLEYQQDVTLPAAYALRLRRELRPLAQQLLSVEDFATLFAPPLPTDPQLLRLVQRPAPSFALQPQPTFAARAVVAGDEEELGLNCFGPACALLPQLLATFVALGRVGIFHGAGRFELLSVTCADLQGRWQSVWRPGQTLAAVAPPLLDAAGWLDGQPAPTSRARLLWQAPLRLISAGRPLFRPDFSEIFPFLLRRVTALMAEACGPAWADEADELRRAAAMLRSDARRLRWEDWRSLTASPTRVELGGVLGELVVEGESLRRLVWLLQLGTLLNVGKGAAYGAGRYTLVVEG